MVERKDQSRNWDHAKLLWQQNKRFLSAEFFLAGFLFDVITLQRIDNFWNLIQQATYHLLILFILILKTKQWQPQSRHLLLSKIWNHHIELLHFLFGSLLSNFTLFYFKSSSLFVSFGFLLGLIALLLLNEMQRFKDLEIPFKWALFSLCLLSFFCYLFPILLGFLGIWPFTLATVATVFIIGILFTLLNRTRATKNTLKKQLLWPALLTVSTFVLAYGLQWIPPVPLSLKFIGIYHQVSRTNEGHYELYHLKPWWKFWHNGDQKFLASPKDQIYCYFRLFSPTHFRDEIRLHWFKKIPHQGWVSQDIIPLKVTGGREEGFRGYGIKTHFSEGTWRVQVETSDSREVGRIYFEVILYPEHPIDYQIDIDKEG